MTRVLIAEPSPDVRALLRRAVGRAGFDGVELTARERTEPAGVDMLLIEPAMRGGLALIRAVRRANPGLPVVMCSIFSPSAETEALGPVAHLVKPFHREELEATLRAAVRPASRERRITGRRAAVS